MKNQWLWNLLAALFMIPTCSAALASGEEDGRAVVQASFDYWRGKTSVATVEMTIHRPDWERTMTMRAWTKGEQDSLVVITAPSKDRGNGTLKRRQEMWTYNPKVNRVIKLPPSMMSQSWMGSDFSNNDLAKSDGLLNDYTHRIVGTERHEGRKVYVIRSTPKPGAPVIWGLQVLRIREDHILLTQEFFDEDHELVKIMTALKIGMLGGRLFPTVWKMRKAEAKDEYTQLVYEKLEFDRDLPDSVFTLSSLKNPPR
ncbi:MAG: outer membrane lipoprotein-sorting protein [Deltaproteobacteria bacterium]|nr:outer membrane lipoprotein-sorting protein [Deltaproteobacteria bacterium]